MWSREQGGSRRKDYRGIWRHLGLMDIFILILVVVVCMHIYVKTSNIKLYALNMYCVICTSYVKYTLTKTEQQQKTPQDSGIYAFL